ncbi:lysophospholipid acyltransferase [Nocardioides speluncae]|uniref:lysophospholipid acyltransferase n=1 Tax=Nocardioides speluncae TaxID=2670337 RepID=UPI00197F40D8|nr:lysophospholipid acyltransferase [Nocardioides speluncae]
MVPEFPGRSTLINSLDRVGARKPLQRFGVVSEPTTALSADPPEVAQLLSDDEFDHKLRTLAEEIGRSPHEVRVDAAAYLREMGAIHGGRSSDAWSRMTNWMYRAHDLLVDEEKMRRLRKLDRRHSLLFLFSHRSYLDGIAVPVAVEQHGLSAPFTMGGANLNFFPVNQLARRAGIVYIRRNIRDLPVYRLTLRSYIGQMVRNQQNLCWSIEGGRTRTGKLRPPTYGILRYVIDGLEATNDSEAVIIPVSIVYEQLHEVSLMTSEARGGNKRPEDLRWLVNFARSQQERLGRAYLDFGEPINLRERLAELRAEEPEGQHAVERIALDASHRINEATPVTATALVCVAMLAADRSLTLGEVMATVAPLARYVEQRNWAVAGAANLTDRATVRRTLQDLGSSGVLTSFDGGTETVWGIGPQKHLVAAFYRNTAVHMLLNRAIGELALVKVLEGGDNPLEIATAEALALRELLKFDFFFAPRGQFALDLAGELAIIDPERVSDMITPFSAKDAARWLEIGRPHLAHLVLRPYLDAYHLVADRLAAWDEDEEFDDTRFLDECLRVGRQWALQRRLASEESLSLELFKPALALARHRGLVESDEPELGKRREDYLDEVRAVVRRLDRLAEMARAQDRQA